ncbi:MAG: sugar phosphate isomerase/epimerase [Clostridia bacterium]|nr:sugar phosphate isomerase/epimerase [Clostridia bacterium]
MKEIGLNLFSLRTLIDTEEKFLQTAQALKEMGYTYLQYSGAAFDPDRIARVSKEVGLPVYLTHVPMDRILNDTEKLMEEHAKFGCKNIGLGSMPSDLLTDEKGYKQKVEELNRAGEKMYKNGFQFFYHHHHYEFFKHGKERVFDYILNNAPYISFTADTYWMQYGGMSIQDTIPRLKGRVGCVHFKDYKIEKKKEGGFEPRFAPVGEGNIDFKKAAALFKEAGTQYFFVEQDDACDYADPLAQVKSSVDYIIKEI